MSQAQPARRDPADWVDEYGDYLYRYAFSRLRDAASAEEVVQETFLSGIRAYAQFEARGSERGWLLGILKRKIIDHIRARNRYDQVTGNAEESNDISERLFDDQGRWDADDLRDHVRHLRYLQMVSVHASGVLHL